jgi:hypothetical protein
MEGNIDGILDGVLSEIGFFDQIQSIEHLAVILDLKEYSNKTACFRVSVVECRNNDKEKDDRLVKD